MTDPERILVTAALPYANGSLHLGHLVEYCQADMYVRALNRLGHNALYICANDAHGTPIEINARRQGIDPVDMVQRIHSEHVRDFARFDVAFDHFGLTHSDTNRRIVEEVYTQLRQAGQLEDRDIDGNWCETDQRFLPDRFIKGTCPKCGATDQYGDVCEVCNSTYAPTDLIEPHCVLCGKRPVTKTSRHVFFKLSSPENVAFLRRWVDDGHLQPEIANYVRGWIDGGLRDWCISRDGPYFGFAIPDRPDKYFYVWLDAPFGYVAASADWGQEHGVELDTLWRSETTRIEHVIGKDIVYFHTLFWPAVLNAVGYSLPAKVHVHGMLTIDGQKMSKSRGTFINAAVFADHVDPQALRYYYACKYGAAADDLDLSLDDFVQRINGELVNKHANLFSRAAQFLTSKLDGRLGDLPFDASDTQTKSKRGETPADPELLTKARQVVDACRHVERAYQARELGQVVRELSLVADIGNETMQSRAPWVQLKTDPEAARLTCTFALNVCHALAMYLWPIVPRFAEAGARVLGSHIDRMGAGGLFRERQRPIGTMERLFERIDRKAIDAIVAASKSATPGPSEAGAGGAGVAARIGIDDFEKVELRVGQVVSAEKVAKSKKLLRLQVDLGEAAPRQIVAGIATTYTPEQLVGRRVVVVANLAPAKLMGVQSNGMVLAAGEGAQLALLQPDGDLPAGSRVR